ncbi:sigma 54-interacting transcriptional regulator [Flavobacterium ginsenosidimutans]|uniref:Sigma 54-interacting transcriptional regulator n=1 Tax=Flavobacterium ginsenosidimutans TaxID=687844 RepID=A0ABZ2Q7R6_9FLAO|nr:sigma 54-interacting transcriptional regulator [Flavobacterium ginsenosidimutans]KAF2326580.1 response regulator [Flavobacterium ginsenosidimutans]
MGSKVLIVEDEFIVANDLQLILKQAGYIVTGIAVSAEEANEHIAKNKPDLVLLDIYLEGKQSGIDLAKKLKAENIAFVYLSANSNQTILEEAKRTDPYGFLVKPFREKDLLITLEIASYRHKNSIESRLRQEELLQKKLNSISLQTLQFEEYLQETARILQAFIPYDLIVFEIKKTDLNKRKSAAYMRIGFDEYQYIGEKELRNIINSKSNSSFTEINYLENETVIYENNTEHFNPNLSFIKDHFRAESFLVFPFSLDNELTIQYIFCSQKKNNYSQHHIDLLTSAKKDFTNLMNGVTNQQKLVDSKKNENFKETISPQFIDIIGKHPLLLNTLDLIVQVAPYNTSVLILGESGTGKEKAAQSIHNLSMRKNGPFVKVNCAAISPTLIESELFGYEKGAFTGAIESRKGKFELADGGTIFLDEIGELSNEMQIRLLRVLQEKEIDSVGGNTARKVDIRIVAATNRNLEKEVALGNFRMDLYYRLNVFPITMPTLRERKSDIPELANYFAEKFCKEVNKNFNGINPKMLQQMNEYYWPGNIRELENFIERSVILNNGKSELDFKLSSSHSESFSTENVQTLEDVKNAQQQIERDYIISILKKANGRIRGTAGAASILNIKPTTLESKMNKLAIKKDDYAKS